MSRLTDPHPVVSPNMLAALLLAARGNLSRLHLPRPTVGQILDATSASRSRAYVLKDKLFSQLSDIERPVGRPRAEPAPQMDASGITDQVLSFIMQHPGCVHGSGERQRYSGSFRCFILELCEHHQQIPLASFAEAAHVPLGTLKDWLRGGGAGLDTPPPALSSATAAKTDPVTTGRVETIIEQWKHWEGGFATFCKHVSYNLRIPFSRTLISSILEQLGLRIPARRPGRSPDEKALRRAFETFFPGAQWVGDGTPITVQIGEQRFTFNIELMVDTHSAANVGVSIRDAEDSEAVIEAFDDGVQTTGAPPLATLLDNRPCNHTEQVEQALDTTTQIYATKGRAQNKAHVEGAFGLFSQVMPIIAITATLPKEVARQALQLVTQTWARTLNHRPRKNRKGLSRVQIYQGADPSPEQVEQARADLEERCKKQELARKTLKARQDPFVRSLLDETFKRLDLCDPTENIRAAIARYPINAIVNGIATFEGKLNACTLPDGVDGRYLLGIVKNIALQDEGFQITEALLQARLEAQDRLLAPLHRMLDSLLQLYPEPVECLKSLTARALESDRKIDQIFWLGAVAKQIRKQPSSRHSALLRFASRRIHATFAVAYRDRLAAVHFLMNRVIPLE